MPRDTTKKILADDSKIWLSKKQLLSQQTSRGLSEQITVSNITQQTAPKQWQMIKGQLTNQSVSYQPISFKKWQHDSRRSLIKSYQKTLHLITVAQANTALKKLGANFKISHLSDFIFLETKTGQVTINQGFIAKGNQLYAISTQYRDSNEPTTFNRGQLFTSHKIAANPTAKPVTLNHLNGTWIAADTTTSANDTGKMMVKDGFLYQQRYDSLERSAIQDLSQYSLMTLNQNTTYAAQKRAAAQADYELTPKSIASGDSIGYLYLFMNDHVLLRIGAGQTTSYQKTDSQLAASDLSQTNQIIFKQLDQQKPGEAASTITVKAGPAVVGMSKSLKYITDATAGQITKDIVISDIQNGQISIASESAQ
ncbi:lipoprotein [Latilactobacillus graminis DSM 20719]|uniref:Lipoprotein n=1 Tax=Latilactobacillus graminis DSM 20719 TaxID=1423752 RepID=A0AA89HZQ0_9LACO|nr:lipoprotein [Latilactobacillus graminis DSM 20719]